MTRAPEPLHPAPIFTSRLIQLFLMVFLLIALINRQRDFSLFILVILGIAFGSKLWSRLSLAHIKTAAGVDRKKLFPGESVRLKIRLENAKWLPVWLRVELPADAVNPAPDDTPLQQESGLLWFQHISFDWTVRPQKRGVYAIGPPRLTVGDLMGFYPQEKKDGEAVELVVFPRLVPLKSFSFPKRDYFGTPGSKSPVHDPVYILGTRDYQSWRPARYIHWKASSRQNRLQEKIFEPSEQAKILLLVAVDQFESQQAEAAFENTLELVASLAVQFHRQGYALGFMTDGVLNGHGSASVPPAKTPRQLSIILELLARLQMKSAGPVDDFFLKAGIGYRGAACARFAFRSDPSDTLIKTRLRQRNIPLVSFLYELDSAARHRRNFAGETICAIEDIRLPGPVAS